jgi:hypothetical protein
LEHKSISSKSLCDFGKTRSTIGIYGYQKPVDIKLIFIFCTIRVKKGASIFTCNSSDQFLCAAIYITWLSCVSFQDLNNLWTKRIRKLHGYRRMNFSTVERYDGPVQIPINKSNYQLRLV